MEDGRVVALIKRLKEKEIKAADMRSTVSRLTLAQNTLAGAIEAMRRDGIPDDEIALMLRRAVDFLLKTKG